MSEDVGTSAAVGPSAVEVGKFRCEESGRATFPNRMRSIIQPLSSLNFARVSCNIYWAEYTRAGLFLVLHADSCALVYRVPSLLTPGETHSF